MVLELLFGALERLHVALDCRILSPGRTLLDKMSIEPLVLQHLLSGRPSRFHDGLDVARQLLVVALLLLPHFGVVFDDLDRVGVYSGSFPATLHVGH